MNAEAGIFRKGADGQLHPVEPPEGWKYPSDGIRGLARLAMERGLDLLLAWAPERGCYVVELPGVLMIALDDEGFDPAALLDAKCNGLAGSIEVEEIAGRRARVENRSIVRGDKYWKERTAA